MQTEDQIRTAQQHLLRLASHLQAVAQGLAAEPLNGLQPLEVLRSAVAAECVQCGIRLTPEEVARLAGGLGNDRLSPRLQRLRQGYCARHGCNSYYYRLTFFPLSGLTWDSVLAKVDDEGLGARSEMALDRSTIRELIPWEWTRCGALLVALIAAGWFARECYLSGGIPFLRRAEQFEVDRSGASEFGALAP